MMLIMDDASDQQRLAEVLRQLAKYTTPSKNYNDAVPERVGVKDCALPQKRPR
jgi:hypothetical protein